MKKLLFILILILLFTSCSTADTVEPPPVVQTNDTGTATAEPETIETHAPLPPAETVETTAQTIAQSSETSAEPDNSGLIIAIDAGHQARGNSEPEAIGPGASETKAKVSSGTAGVSTKTPEYELTLTMSLKLRDELARRGYTVYMIRETHDVNISNQERAELAAQVGADIFLRIHANGDSNPAVNGVMTISPTAKTPFIPALYTRSRALSQCLLDEILSATGASSKGVWETDTMSGIKWSSMPVSIIEMGFMSNPEEDQLMQTPDYQQKLVEGMANGIDLYFSTEAEAD